MAHAMPDPLCPKQRLKGSYLAKLAMPACVVTTFAPASFVDGLAELGDHIEGGS